MKKRIISLILALVMIGSILVSCGGNDGGGTDTAPDDIDFRISGARVIALEVGETYQLVINLSCEVVSAVEWFVSGEAASVSSGGLVTAISAGEATITAVYGEYSDSVKITVTESEDEGEDDMESFEPSAEVLAVKGGASGIVVLQHDDAYPETAVVIDGLLAKYGLVADVAMLSNRVYNYANGKAKADIVEFWQQILDTGRWKITSHSATHTWWGTATSDGAGGYNIADNEEKMYAEIVGSQQILRQLFPGQRVLTFAYPGFSTEKNNFTNGTEEAVLKYIYSEAARELINETYIAGRRVQTAYSVTDNSIDWTMSGSYHVGGNYTTSYVEKAGNQGLFTVLYVHNVMEVPEDQLKTFNYPANTMAAYYFEELCKQVRAGVDSGAIWNTHYEDAVLYLREAQSASVSVSGDKSGITVILTDGMDNSIYNYPLSVRIRADESWQAVKVTQNGKVSFAKVEYEAYEFYGGEYYAIIDVVPDGGEATVEPVSPSEVPEIQPEDPKPTPSVPGSEGPKAYLSFEQMPAGDVGEGVFIVDGLNMRHNTQANADADAVIVEDGDNKYILVDKRAISSTTSSQNWLNIIRDGSADGDGGYILLETRLKINVVTNSSGLYFRPYNGRDAASDGGTYAFNYAFKQSGGVLTYNNQSLGVSNNAWFTMRVVMTAENEFTILIKNESGSAVTVGGVSYADGEFIPRFTTVADGISTVDGFSIVSSSGFIGSFAIDYVSFGYVTEGGDDDEPPHEHEFVEGECACGTKDPNYIPEGGDDDEPPHEHEFVEGECACGTKDPNYIPEDNVDDGGWTH